MASIYYINLSVFQSVPDSWAINQLFPIMPINRLDEEPTQRGILADLTCDSDGKIDQFIDLRDVKSVLELHTLKPGEPYYLALFLGGAYQEIMGNLHNLLGMKCSSHSANTFWLSYRTRCERRHYERSPQLRTVRFRKFG